MDLNPNLLLGTDEPWDSLHGPSLGEGTIYNDSPVSPRWILYAAEASAVMSGEGIPNNEA